MPLLSTGNAKTMKGEAFGYRTFIMHFAPAFLSGFNVCPMASLGCAAACLNTAGRGVYAMVQQARIARTLRFFNDRETFMSDLVTEVAKAAKSAKRAGLIPVFRLNGTSDIRWETVPVVRDGVKYANIMLAFADLTFYDYTKIGNRKGLPSNYTLTFSRSEDNHADVNAWLQNGGNVAVVFGVKKGKPLPTEHMGYTVVDGDLSDLRFLDGKNVIVGLRAKGKGVGETSGFVVTNF